MRHAPLTETQLKHCFDQIRQDYFKNWKASHSWRCELSDDLDQKYRGHYDSTKKVISIARKVHPKDLEIVLIHTMCHAWDGPHHDHLWCRRMRLVVEIALSLGNSALAERIEENITDCEDKVGECEGFNFD